MDRYLLDLKKANPVEDADGMLTRRGMEVAHRYAKLWVDESKRDLNLEREFPEMAGLFYDIRTDIALAHEHAIPFSTGEAPEEVKKAFVFVVPLDEPEPPPPPRPIQATPGSLDAAKICIWKDVGKKVVVWLVEGTLIRDSLDIDFIGGGHHERFEWIPENEVWIDVDTAPDERKLYAVHELLERNMMRSGMDYDAAHAKASEMEQQYRANPEILTDEVLRQAV